MTKPPNSKTKIPPNSKESEMMVLGSMLTNINSLNIASDNLDEHDFYYGEHKIIFQSLKKAYLNDRPADIHLIAEELKREDKLQEIGGINYLVSLAQYAGVSAYIEEYTEIVKNKSVLRRMILAAQEVEKDAILDPSDVHTVLDTAQQKFFEISQAANPNVGTSIEELIIGANTHAKKHYLEALQQKQEEYRQRGPNELSITGIPTHFMDLDKMIGGFSPSNLMILAARPAMGKTALALNIAEHVCFKNSVPVGIFSLEMTADQLLHRIICSQSEVESDKIKTGSLNGSEYQRIVAAVNYMQSHVMVIDDTPGIKITDLRARARRMKETHKIGFLVIDYLQLLSGSGSVRSVENRQNEISEISRMLKILARELNIPILCLSQLSRKVEERQGHRPMMSDLRESGCLAGDTLIKDAETGQLYTIKELAERKEQTPIKVFAVDQELKLGVHTLSKAFYSGKKKVYEIKTATGRTIKASANHPFLKVNGWTRLDQLKTDDRIGMPRCLNTSNSSRISKEEIALLGHLLGDGCILPNQPYHYTSADPLNLDIVASSASSLFGIEPRLIKQKNWFHLYFPSPYHLTHKKYHPITLWFRKLGIDRCRSYEKKIPNAIFESSENDRLHFLHHLWATDGNISSKKIPGRKPSGSIYYCSSSKVLADQVQHLLLTLGIQSSCRMSPSKKQYRPMHCVYVEGKHNQTQFLSKVGCAGNRGKKIPLLLEDLEKIESNPNTDIVPREAWQLFVRPAKDRADLSWRDLAEKLNMSYCGSTLYKSGISRKRMESLYTITKDPSLLQLAESGVYWDKIVSITEIGEEDVYDATVPGVHNFVANDFIVHNSLEQDSDLVMFLLRREYYDPYDKPGLAELIVAKNRHGGIGNITLTFRKEFAQFANYTRSEAKAGAQTSNDAFAAFSPD